MTVTARNVFNPRSTRFVGFESHTRHEYVCFYSVLPFVSKDPAMDLSHAQKGSTYCLKRSRVLGINFEPWKKTTRNLACLQSLMLELVVFLPRSRRSVPRTTSTTNLLLQNLDGVGDVLCCVRLERKGRRCHVISMLRDWHNPRVGWSCQHLRYLEGGVCIMLCKTYKKRKTVLRDNHAARLI